MIVNLIRRWKSRRTNRFSFSFMFYQSFGKKLSNYYQFAIGKIVNIQIHSILICLAVGVVVVVVVSISLIVDGRRE